jgi:hypothetical protein
MDEKRNAYKSFGRKAEEKRSLIDGMVMLK